MKISDIIWALDAEQKKEYAKLLKEAYAWNCYQYLRKSSIVIPFCGTAHEMMYDVNPYLRRRKYQKPEYRWKPDYSWHNMCNEFGSYMI